MDFFIFYKNDWFFVSKESFNAIAFVFIINFLILRVGRRHDDNHLGSFISLYNISFNDYLISILYIMESMTSTTMKF